MTQTVKSLFISEYFPDEPKKMVHGAFQRLRRHIEALSSIGPVDFVFLWPLHWFESESRQLEYVEAFRQEWSISGRIILIAPPVSPEDGQCRPRRLGVGDALAAMRGAVSFNKGMPTMRSSRFAEVVRLEQTIGELKPDLIFAHRLASTAALIRITTPLPPIMADFDDLEHIALRRAGLAERSRTSRARLLLAARLARRTERLVARFATVGLVCSELDRQILNRLAPGARIEVAPNGPPTPASLASPVPPGFLILFVGYARYEPNAEGILWLIRRIFPLVRAQLPQARLMIIGDGSRELGIGDSEPGVEVLGFVPDLQSAYERARLVVCPVRRGAGTRIKIIEAALHGRPVVSTSVGAEGLDLLDGRDLILADDEKAFAEAIVDLLSNDEKAGRIGAAASDRARRVYAADKIRSNLACLARSLAMRERAPAGGERSARNGEDDDGDAVGDGHPA